MSEWISVEVSLPGISSPYIEYGDWVLVYCSDGLIKVACPTWVDMDDDLWVWKDELGCDIEVTHWQSLPEPPAT